MINFSHIRSIALYERKTLYRSWFFRIFALLTLFILFGMNMGIFGNANARWEFRAIPANIPYVNILFVNVAQAVIAVFLASDFMRRDKKLDTTEVIYARPISNGEYVVGKTWGIVSLFIGLQVAVMLMALLFNLLIKDAPVVWEAYLFYPILVSVPTLVFILGLSFMLMIILRSQAVTFLVLLGYIGLTLFYFKDKVYGLFDYMAFNIPMVYSDFIGFGDPDQILLHRLAYFLMGMGFIFATIRFLSRLPQTGRWHLLNLAGFVLLFAAGLYLGGKYYINNDRAANQREQIVEVNNRYALYPRVDVLSNDLRVEHSGRKLSVQSDISFFNQNRATLDTLIFSLNPGFHIDSITMPRGIVSFSREGALVLAVPSQPLRPMARGRMRFYYAGTPDIEAGYPDILPENRAALKRIMVATLDKMPGVINPEYVLLTRELFWYPVAGVGFNIQTHQPYESDYAHYSLSVKTSKGLTAISTGARTMEEEWQVFTPEQNLNAVPLVIGPYEQRSLVIDSMTYSLYIKPGHDFFSGQFTEVGDTLAAVIKEERDDYEYDELDLYYGFPRFSLVEVPVQFHPYERSYVQYVDMVQPEMIFLPEKGAGLSTLDFKRFRRTMEERNEERNRTSTTVEMEVDLVKNFLQNTFFRSDLEIRRGFRGNSMRLLTYDGEDIFTRNPFTAFPLYYNLSSGIPSREYPLFNSMIETYLKDGYEVSRRQSFRGGLTENERANLALKEHSLTEILAMQDQELSAAAIYQSGSFILSALRNRVGSEELDYFLYYYLEDYAFTDISFQRFSRDFRAEFGFDIAPYLEFIKTGKGLPEFIVSEPEYYQTRDEYGDVFIVRIRVSNVGSSTGLISFSFMIPGQRGFGGGPPPSEERLYEVDAGTTKEIQAVFYEQPRLLTVNTVISGNIPSTFSVFLRSARERTMPGAEDYEREVENPDYSGVEGEIVVDNEDPGFSFVSVSQESKLKQYIESRKPQIDEINYEQINPWWSPSVWTPVAHSAMHGTTVRSAMITRSGDGSNIARWETVLPSTGFYDLYVYIPVSAMYRRPSRRDRGNRDGGGGGGQEQRRFGPEFADRGTEYHYVISSEEGTEEVSFNLSAPEDGWNRLGTFHFPADSVKVELSNRTNGSRVIADAVKFVVK